MTTATVLDLNDLTELIWGDPKKPLVNPPKVKLYRPRKPRTPSLTELVWGKTKRTTKRTK